MSFYEGAKNSLGNYFPPTVFPLLAKIQQQSPQLFRPQDLMGSSIFKMDPESDIPPPLLPPKKVKSLSRV